MGRRGPMPSQSSERTATGRNTAAITRRPVARESVTPPAHVSARPTALAFWEMHAPTLAEEGRLRQIHAETFGQLCHLHADIRQLSEQIAQEGWITATDKGQSVSPVARLLRDSRRDYVTLSGKFGLSAADEARIPTDEAARGEEDQDEKALREFTG